MSNIAIIETIKGNWSARELKRQINSLVFERIGLILCANKNNGTNKSALSKVEFQYLIYKMKMLKCGENREMLQ